MEAKNLHRAPFAIDQTEPVEGAFAAFTSWILKVGLQCLQVRPCHDMSRQARKT